MSGVGFVMLAHARFDRAAQVVRHVAAGGSPVVVHLDVRTPAQTKADFTANIGQDAIVLSEHAADWGRFGLVAATLTSTERLLADHPGLSHVCLISGACLPLRPMPDLQGFLGQSGDQDFIETVPVASDQWVEDGLSIERFTLYHPFSHRRQPWWFSRAVDVQRVLKIRRRLPQGLIPHLGGQWWCLSVPTLRAILDHPDRPRWQRFFRTTWIPDESFFQSFVRIVRPDREPGPALHLGRFNRRGRPIVFHDDHLEYLTAADHFFARKIDPDAEGLYKTFLNSGLAPCGSQFSGAVDETPIVRARDQVAHEGRGVLGPGRLPKGSALIRCDTVRPYLVLHSPSADLLEALLPRLQAGAPDQVTHGRLFREGSPAGFACGSIAFKGNLVGQQTLRDYRPAQFLSRLLWADRDRAVAFLLGPGDDALIRHQLANDPNARLVVLDDTDTAEAFIRSLTRPLGGNSRDKGRSSPLRSRYRTADPTEIVRDLEGKGDGRALQALLDLLKGDLDAATGWNIPP
ncbi:MAG: beta-1,6-N-acetylglucosaminyltransferase [Paracoccaceae bacterium]